MFPVRYQGTLLGAITVRVPPEGWSPNGGVVAPVSGMPVNEAFRTRPFWLLWVVLFCNVTAGIGILEQASPMIRDLFPAVTPAEVTRGVRAAFSPGGACVDCHTVVRSDAPGSMGYGIAGSLLGGIVGRLLGLGNFGLVLGIACAAGLIWYFRRRVKTPGGPPPPG